MKTARFSDLVETAGGPSPHTIWVDPKDDPELQRAIKADRVLTIHQANVGQSKDYGTVGYKADPQSQFLIFPKSLKRFRDRRVVGINYDKVETPPIQRAKTKDKVAKRPASPRHGKTDTTSQRSKPLAAAVESFREPAETSKNEKSILPDRTVAAAEPTKERKRSFSPKEISLTEILKEVRAVLKALESGKSVPAYRHLKELAERLEKSV